MKRDLPDGGDPILEWPDQEVEQMLGRIPLTRPSARLDQRVRNALTPRGPGGWFAVGALSSAAAAAIILFALPALHRHPTEAPPPPDQVAGPAISPLALAAPPPRLRVEQDAAGIEDDGIVAHIDGVPLREYRCRALRQVWYFDSRRQTHLAVTVPVEQVVIVPVRTF